MSRTSIDDRKLLKLLETGVGTCAAAKQLDLPIDTVTRRVKEYLNSDILRCNGGGQVIDWKAYGRWLQSRKTSEAA